MRAWLTLVRLKESLKVWGGAAAIAVGAHVTVPVGPVPMTLQTLAVTLSGGLGGPKIGALAASLYLALVVLGAPILAEGKTAGGLQFLDLKSGGYVVAFIPAAYFSSALRLGPLFSFMRMLAAHGIILALGATWLALHIGVTPAWSFGVLPFLPGAVVKSVMAAVIVEGFRKLTSRSGP